MKKYIFHILIFLVFSFFSQNVSLTFAMEDPLIIESEVSIEKIELIKKYIESQKKKLEIFWLKYDFESNITLKNNLHDLKDMIDILEKLKTINIEQKRLNEIVKTLVWELKRINHTLKPLLIEKKLEFETKLERKKQAYSRLWDKLWAQLSGLIKWSLNNIKINQSTDSNRQAIIKWLINLEKESQNLQNFENIYFKNENEMKFSFLRIIKNIKRELNEIKNIIQK